MIDLVELVLGCASWTQAQDVTDHLLRRRLITRAESLAADEIKLLLTTTTHFIDDIEAELKEFLNLDELTLHRIPLSRFNHYTVSGLELPLS